MMTVVLLAASAPAYGQSYAGAERCGQCHEFAFQVWSKSRHAKANKALTHEQLADTRCNTCHTIVDTTTAGQAAGTGPNLAGVQCESCHGPGKIYQAPYVMKDHELARAVGLVDPTAVTCQQCHTEGAPSIAPFDFKTLWARIDHGKAARLKWEKARKGKGR